MTYVILIQLAFLTLCDLALNPPFLGGKMIEIGKFCFIKRNLNQIYRVSVNKRLSLTMCEVSAANFEISPRKYAMKKCIFSASIYMGKFRNLIQIFNNYEGTKCQTIVYKQKIVHFIFS